MMSAELRKCWRWAYESGGNVKGVGIELGAGGMAEGGVDHDGVALEARDHVQVNFVGSLQHTTTLCQSANAQGAHPTWGSRPFRQAQGKLFGLLVLCAGLTIKQGTSHNSTSTEKRGWITAECCGNGLHPDHPSYRQSE